MKILGGIWQSFAKMNDRISRNGMDFSGWKTNEELGIDKEKGNQYQPSSDGLIKVLKRLSITKQDSIIDIGCGKGKAMWMMGKYDFGKIAGFDLSDEMVKIASENLRSLNDPRYNVFVADAAGFTDYDEYNFFYLANSVPESVFEKMVLNIEDSLKRIPRKAYFICMNPHYEEYLTEKTEFKLKSIKRSIIKWFSFKVYTNF